MNGTFLDKDEIKVLTDRCQKKQQMEVLRANGIPFFTSATGHPKVARCAIEGRNITTQPPSKKAWIPRVLKSG